MFTGEIRSQLREIGPAEPIPTHTTRTSCWSAASSCCSTMPVERLEVVLRADVGVDRDDGPVEQLAAHQ